MKPVLIEIEGDAWDRGHQYGASARSAIRYNIEAYFRLLEFHAGLSRPAAQDAARAFEPMIATHTPDLWQEMQGIAAGAGCDPVDILLLNSRSELMKKMGECTALAASPNVTQGGQVLLGQNWDWYTSVESDPLVLRIRQPDKPEILTLVEAGQVAKIGMNSAGLGVCLNFLEHADEGMGMPVHVILRQILNCAHLGEAIREAYRLPRGGAANILLGHAAGEVLDLEMTAADIDFLYADPGWLVHANHFESMRLRAGDRGILTSQSTLARAARARRLLAAAAAQAAVSLDTYSAILTDHAYGSYAICRHVSTSEPPLQQTATRASVIMDLTARTMRVTIGQPCRQPYHTIACSS